MDRALLWLAINACIVLLLIAARQHILQPLGHIALHMHRLRNLYMEDERHSPLVNVTMLHVARDVGRFAGFALEYYKKNQEISSELEHSRMIIAQFALQQKTTLASADREIGEQYRSVLAYANYLEEHILSHKLDPTLRYDFDDVCESSFNLKLIAGALSTLSGPAQPTIEDVSLAGLMQQTILSLAPSLDRRSMKLTTAEVDLSVMARGDAKALALVLWMMLLGMIRYAEAESTLRMRCLYSRDMRKALLSIVISELSPGSMSPQEREDHLLRQLQHLTPHMFAETIRIHGNVQLADMLVKRLEGSISILPLTTTSCEICMVLPAACMEGEPSVSNHDAGV